MNGLIICCALLLEMSNAEKHKLNPIFLGKPTQWAGLALSLQRYCLQGSGNSGLKAARLGAPRAGKIQGCTVVY